ncbi:MAG: GntR family transcriptional regulator [Nocardioides sp.]
MIVVIDSGATDPPYDQVKTQIAALVDSGELAAGDKLPTVRRLAADLGLAPNTVARAYRELEASGVVSTRGRGGTFVSGNEVDRAARRAAAEYADQMRSLGIAADQAIALVKRSLAISQTP